MPTAVEIRERAVWLVEYGEDVNKMTQGTCFFLKNVGLVTADHCLTKDVEEFDVYHPSKRSNVFKVKTSQRDQYRDLAILKHGIPSVEYFEPEAAACAVAKEQKVIALGYPNFGPGDGLNVRSGTVSSLSIKSGIDLIEVTQKFGEGMSGGPLLNDDNMVVGIIHKGGKEERNFAINIGVLNNWINLQ